jgi:ABC-type Na+ efflux pump permease subunit
MQKPGALGAIAIFARTMLIEARRGGLPWVALASIVIVVALASFLSAVAVTEAVALQAAIAAALLRACAVFFVAVQVATSTAREHDDKGLELMLALPLPRSTQYLGRWSGHALVAVLLAAIVSVPLLLWCPPLAVGLWALSLAVEAAMVAAAALFFSMAFAQLLPAVTATAAFYLLARSIGTIQAIAATQSDAKFDAQSAARGVVDVIALMLPRLDAVTRADWLVYGLPAAGQAAAALAGLALYAILLLAAGLIDFQRRAL